LSKKAAEVALRMLGGEKGRDIKPSFVTPALPRFDWRQMQRWKVSESALPLGSKIDFRAPTMWDQYKLHILGAVCLIVAQAVLIGWLFRYAREIAKLVIRCGLLTRAFASPRARGCTDVPDTNLTMLDYDPQDRTYPFKSLATPQKFWLTRQP